MRGRGHIPRSIRKWLRPLCLLMVSSILILTACVPSRKMKDGEFLLVKNKVEVNPKVPAADDIYNYIKQKENRSQWGTYIRIRIFNTFNKGKDNKAKAWFRRTLGSEPIFLDTSLTDQSVHQIKLYLDTKGHFNSGVQRKITYKKHKAKVTYLVSPAAPYFIRDIKYVISNPTMDAFVQSAKPRSLLKSGDQYDAEVFADERERITEDLHNLGFYYFNSNYIHFRIDTTGKDHQMDVEVDISDPYLPVPGFPDSLVRGEHKRYYNHNTYIMMDVGPAGTDSLKSDTLKVTVPARKKKDPPKTYYFVYHDQLKIKPKTITQQIFVDSGDFYRYKDVEKTHKQLYELRVFKYVNILYDDLQVQTGPEQLDCKIFLSRLPVQAFMAETQITNRGGNLGTSAGIVYSNRNLFHGADIFQWKLNGAFEIEKLSFNTSKEDRAIQGIPFFNTIEAGTEFNIRVPKFLLPVRQERFSKNFRPKTNISAGFNYQQRADFTRYITHASMGYEWKESSAKTHYLTPLDLNAVIINPDSAFSVLIENMPDKIMQNTYKDHIITSLKYSFVYNTQVVGQNHDFMYFRGNIELAGVLFWLFNEARGKSSAWSLFNIPYSQFARVDLDYRYYKYFHKGGSLASRIYSGIGLPLTSKNSLPFEKHFYLGGSNSMRGWRLRTLGPGSYDEGDTVRIDNIGDIGLEMNLEYRFPIYKYLKGALFVDAGNVWLRKENPLYPNGNFEFNRFYKEIAFDAGAGIRLDFDFLLVRLDGAIPLKEPRMPEGQRWIFQNDRKFKIYGNLGIGYPF